MEGNENWKASEITDAQRKKLFALLSENKIDKDIFEGTVEKKISELSKGEASECIDILINKEDKIGSLRLWSLFEKQEEQISQKEERRDAQTSIVPKPKAEMVIGKAERMAQMYGIPTELANMFFMTIDGALYVKSPGLLYMAGKKGYSRKTPH